MPGSSKWYLSLRFTHQTIDFITRTMFGEEYRSLSYSLCIFLHSAISSSLLGTNIPLSKYQLYQIYLNVVYRNKRTYINIHSEVGAHMF